MPRLSGKIPGGGRVLVSAKENHEKQTLKGNCMFIVDISKFYQEVIFRKQHAIITQLYNYKVYCTTIQYTILGERL